MNLEEIYLFLSPNLINLLLGKWICGSPLDELIKKQTLCDWLPNPLPLNLLIFQHASMPFRP